MEVFIIDKLSEITAVTLNQITSQESIFSAESSGQLAKFVQRVIGNNAREEVLLLNLNSKNQVVSYHVANTGGIREAPIDIRYIFQVALLANASHIVLAHNHPSGDLTPSQADIETFKNVTQAGFLMGVPLMESLIVGANNPDYYSFAEHGSAVPQK